MKDELSSAVAVAELVAEVGIAIRSHAETEAEAVVEAVVTGSIQGIGNTIRPATPLSAIKWTRRTTSKISEQLSTLAIAVSKNTAGRLLKQMDFRLRVNRKQIASTKCLDHNQQFLYIAQ